MFLGVLLGALGIHVPLVPAQVAPQGNDCNHLGITSLMTRTIQKPPRKDSNQPKPHG